MVSTLFSDVAGKNSVNLDVCDWRCAVSVMGVQVRPLMSEVSHPLVSTVAQFVLCSHPSSRTHLICLCSAVFFLFQVLCGIMFKDPLSNLFVLLEKWQISELPFCILISLSGIPFYISLSRRHTICWCNWQIPDKHLLFLKIIFINCRKSYRHEKNQ